MKDGKLSDYSFRMATSRPDIVAPSFSQHDEMGGDQFADMEEDFNDDDQFEEFSMDQDYGMSDSFENEKVEKNTGSSKNKSQVASVPPHTSKPSTSGWSTIKFNTDNFSDMPKGETDKSSSNQGSRFPDLQNAFDDRYAAEDGHFDYQHFQDQGYDDHMVTNEHVSPVKNNQIQNEQLNTQGQQKANFSKPNIPQNQNANAISEEQYGADPFQEFSEDFDKDNVHETFNELEQAEPQQSLEDLADELAEGGDEQQEANDEEGDNGDDDVDDDYDEDGESEGEYSEDVSDDEDINEALNSLGDLDAGKYM